MTTGFLRKQYPPGQAMNFSSPRNLNHRGQGQLLTPAIYRVDNFPLILIMREHTFLHLPASYFISTLPSLTQAVLHDSSQMVEICADKTVWFILADSILESSGKHAIEIARDKVSTPPSPLPPLPTLSPFPWNWYVLLFSYENLT